MKDKIVKNYKEDDVKRASFNQLATDTFSISFEKWYQKGMWNDHYVNYSYFDEQRCIANASFNKMTLMVDGETIQAIQIGTVMTHPDYRGRGYAQQLIEEIIKDQQEGCELFFLCAEANAANLYRRCGFEYRNENTYIIDASVYEKLASPLQAISLTPAQFAEAKLKSKPLSKKLSAIDDLHIANFYYSLGYDQMIYAPREGVYVIFEIEGDTLTLYDVYTNIEVELETLIPLMVHEGIAFVKCLFTPDKMLKGLSIVDGNKDWMVKPNPKKLPDGHVIPLISRA